jgi:superfamily II DNA or RNA helicase
MSIFELHDLVINEYRKYVQSFLSVADERVAKFIEKELLDKNTLWPDALLQLNPAYEMAATVEELVHEGKLHPLTAKIFRTEKDQSIHLYRHQQRAIEKALNHEHFVVTSGTGSGKSLTYFIPIVDAVLRSDLQEAKVWAIIIYPMNALVNSQYESLERLAEQYRMRQGRIFPVRFAKYTGQEREEEKHRLQQNPPHILLTNYVMLELMLVRPEEHNFVDRMTTRLQFLVLDELHTYRGRQGADVALLIRRLRERCGNPNLLCIGTSATMATGKATTPQERCQAVAGFASNLFGIAIEHENVIEESLRRITPAPAIPATRELRQAILDPLPANLDQLLDNPLTPWIELTFGLEQEPGGSLRRRTPISLAEGAKKLAEITEIDIRTCEARLRELFLAGSQLQMPDGSPLFAFKLHQFIAQGRNIYATLEPTPKRFLTMEGQYYAAPINGSERILYPLLFCRVCGQDYYAVLIDEDNSRLYPYEPQNEALAEEGLCGGYLVLAQEDTGMEWSIEHLPAEWMDHKGRIKRDWRPHIPYPLWVLSDGTFEHNQLENSVKAWFQPKPFMLCLNCGEFYTRRGKNDFRKLAGLSSEGRSTATTILSVSTLRHAYIGQIAEPARKILSFTDNRQDASLQAGHFNDFVQVSLLRAAIYASLKQHHQLRFADVAEKVVSSMGLTLKDVAANPQIKSDTPQGREVWAIFRELIEYRIYEDLQRGWRVVQPNLEQCGLLSIEYAGLADICNQEANWADLTPFKGLTPKKRKEVLTALLDHFRKKLAIHIDCLKEQFQQQLRKRVHQQINEQWAFDESEELYTATRFLLPGQSNRSLEGMSLGENSLIGRYLRRTLTLSEPYPVFIQKLINMLCSYGILRKGSERGIEFVQLDASAIIWNKGSGTPPLPDPIYSRRVTTSIYAEVQRDANKFFRDFYQQAAGSLQGIEGSEHTAQISYAHRQEREHRFREGTLACLFCSPTMELGIDIADLQLVHLRNVPPSPANYAQRSGRAGRKGDPALVLTYCAAGSGHDQYFFRHREHMVAGAVRPPRIDLGNEDLIKAHVHAIWLAKIRISLGSSIAEILELNLDNYPLKENVAAQIHLTEPRLQECLKEARDILQSCGVHSISERLVF